MTLSSCEEIGIYFKLASFPSFVHETIVLVFLFLLFFEMVELEISHLKLSCSFDIAILSFGWCPFLYLIFLFFLTVLFDVLS